MVFLWSLMMILWWFYGDCYCVFMVFFYGVFYGDFMVINGDFWFYDDFMVV